MKRYEFKKLIRAKLPARMIEERVSINDTELDDKQYILELKKKLIEEAYEVLDSENSEELSTELADVLEVVDAIISANKLTYQDIIKIKNEKREVNGDFSLKKYINYIEVEESNHKVINYLKNKKRPYKNN